MKTVYKVVRFRKNGHRLSARRVGFGCLRYYKNKWTKPTIPKSKIFAFKTIRAARRFISSSIENDQIWEAVAVLPKMTEVQFIGSCNDSRKTLELVWKKNGYHMNYIIKGLTPPDDTVFCNKLKLVRRVW